MPMIVRLGLSGAAVGLASLPAFLMPACLSNSATATGADSGSPATTSSSSSGGGSGSSGAVATGDGGGAATCNLDDMSSPATVTGGYWFTYSDRTCPNTALLVPDAAGTLSPIEGYASNPAADMTGVVQTTTVTGLAMPVGFREFSGGGEKTWGAGFGFNLLNNGTNPFTVCPASTCTGTPPMVDAAVGFPAPYDASMHKGVSFFAKSLMATATLPTKVRVQLSDHHTDPGSGMPGAEAGAGICDQCDQSQTGADRCSNDFYQSINLTPTWTQYTVLFAQIATDTWTKTYAKGQFDPTTLYHVHFQLNAPTPMFDIQIACVSWVDM
jgi:hypothetical protein